MKHALIPYTVTHHRLVPRRYRFTHSFFWFKFDLDAMESWPSSLFSVNRFNVYSFHDEDHIKFGKNSARDNYITFARLNGVLEEITSVILFTQVRFLGYVFNPVSFVIMEGSSGRRYGIIEIGNTFNEQKPFFVDHHCFSDNGFTFKTKKYFYISPFIDHDNEMEFRFIEEEAGFRILVDDARGDETILKVWMDARETKATTWQLIWQTVKFPFVTAKAIFLIHFHAFILWMMGIPYFKKEEKKHLQKGTMIWKTSKPR